MLLEIAVQVLLNFEILFFVKKYFIFMLLNYFDILT